jgi:hypothetical protein
MFKKLLLVFSGKMSLNPSGYLAYLALERNPQLFPVNTYGTDLRL